MLKELREEAAPDGASPPPPSSRSRAVLSGHYVRVSLEPLPDPELVVLSPRMCGNLGIRPSDVSSDGFVRAMAGGAPTEAVAEGPAEAGGSATLEGAEQEGAVPWVLPNGAWATGYAVSIGGRNASTSPFGPFGYGDGRAASIAEVVAQNDPAAPQEVVERWELQLKGCGRTPFSRNFDGRAVLRSSLREFMASEAMAGLGVPSTRALVLVASRSLRVARPWYPPLAPGAASGRRRPHAPSMEGEERVAVLCRCASSFLRVGHFEVMAERGDREGLELLVRHALRREFPDLCGGEAAKIGAMPLDDAVIALFTGFATRQADLVANWLRVGYVQGNMNSDNCHIGGCTLDFGPFAFMESFDPDCQQFTGDVAGRYAFSRQAEAAEANAGALAAALLAVFPERSGSSSSSDSGAETPIGRSDHASGEGGKSDAMRSRSEAALRQALAGFRPRFRSAHSESCRRKLGLVSWDGAAAQLWDDLLHLMRRSRADFTVFFRLLADDAGGAPRERGAASAVQGSSPDAAASEELPEWLLRSLPGGRLPVGSSAAVEGAVALRAEWWDWLRRLRGRVLAQGWDAGERRADMHKVSPKYVPRNWMLLEAYEAAENGNYAPARGMLELLSRPYEEHPEFEAYYFRPPPEWAAGAPGLAYMS